MKILKNKIFVYLCAILAGYMSMIMTLGDEGPQLLKDKVPQDVLLRRNFLFLWTVN